MAGKSYKYEARIGTVRGLISDFYNEVEGLAEEAREVVDNASENLQQSERIQTFEATADTLENMQEPDMPESVPESVWEELLNVQVAVPRNKRAQASRAVRMENACAYGRAAHEFLTEMADGLEEQLEEARKSDDPPDADDEREAHLDELRDYLEELDGHIAEAEEVEFPGIYG